MKTAFLTVLLALVFFNLTAQKQNLLKMKDNGLGYRFYYKDEKISKRHLKSMLAIENPQACRLFIQGMHSSVWEWVAGVPGGAVFGWELGMLMAGGPINIPVFSASIVVCAASTWFYNRKKRCYIRTLGLYNNHLPQSSFSFRPDFGITNSGGIGLKWRLD